MEKICQVGKVLKFLNILHLDRMKIVKEESRMSSSPLVVRLLEKAIERIYPKARAPLLSVYRLTLTNLTAYLQLPRALPITTITFTYHG